MYLSSQQLSTTSLEERLAPGRAGNSQVPAHPPRAGGFLPDADEADDAAQAFDMLLKASMDEATDVAHDKEETEDLRVDGKWESGEDNGLEDDDSDFSVADGEDDDDEEYLDTHMQHKKSQRRSRRSQGKSVPREARPVGMVGDRIPTTTSVWSGALGYLASIAGTDFVDSLDDVQQQFLATLPERLYLSRSKPNEILNLKCSNRECSNVRGNPKKPNSIYCCSKCQSREQNLRQGRVKNVRRLSAASPISKSSHKKTARRNSSGSLPKRIYSQTAPPLASPYRSSAALPAPLSMRTLPPPIQRALASGPEQAARDKLSLSFLLQAGASTPSVPAQQPLPVRNHAVQAHNFQAHGMATPAMYSPVYRPHYPLMPQPQPQPLPNAYQMQQPRAMPHLGGGSHPVYF